MVIAAVCAYAVLVLFTARKIYSIVRPSKAVTCGKAAWAEHYIRRDGKWQSSTADRASTGHFWCCYRRFRTVDYLYEALWYTIPAALAFPLFWTGWSFWRVVTWNLPEDEGEKKDRLAKLNADIASRERELAN